MNRSVLCRLVFRGVTTHHRVQLVTALLALFVATFIGRPAAGQIQVGPSGPIALSTFDVPYTQDFDSLATSGLSSALPAGWAFAESGFFANPFYVAEFPYATLDTTRSAGVEGTNPATDRAFGIQRLDESAFSRIGARFVNNTGSTIEALDISYRGEEWFFPSGHETDRLDFQYSVDASNLSTGTWIDTDALDFTSPNIFSPPGGDDIDGNHTMNFRTRSASITSLSIPDAAPFWIRWTPFTETGFSAVLAVDDFSLTPLSVPPSTWTGGAGDGWWSTPENWTTAPSNGSNLVFADSTGLFPYNDFLSDVGSITFDSTAASFYLYGGSVTISGGMRNNSSTRQIIDLDLTLAGPQQFISHGPVNSSVAFRILGNIDNNGNTLTAEGFMEFGNQISGAGGLTVAADSTVFLYSNNTYSGGTVVNVGASLRGDTNTLQGNIVTAQYASVDFWQSFGGTYAGNMSGGGRIWFQGNGSGTLTLSGVNTYTGGTVADGGTLAGSTNSLQGNIIIFPDAVVRFNQDFAGTYSGNMSGGGSLQVFGGSTLVLNGTNTYTGGTTITGGKNLEGTTNGLQGNISTDFGSHVTFNQNFAGTYAGQVSGPGDLTITGGGTVTLTGANNYTGGTKVNGGALVVNGSVSGAVAVSSGATLGGSGSVGGNVSVVGGGIVAPGNSAGTLTVGSLTLNNGSFFQVQLGGINRGSEYDAIIATGSVSLGGTLQVTLINPFTPAAGNSFDILDWGSLSGTFDTVALPTLNASLMWNASQLYTAGMLSVALAGDYNNNGVVDAADYVVWRKNDGSPGGYNTWRANFGSTLGSGSAAGTGLAPVPEPSSIVLAAAGIAGLMMWRRSRRFE